MIELQRHIEILLLGNDCVIVPDFGGFVAHRVPARYDEQDSTLLPPLRTLGFNPQLRINDSLLVQSYITAYDISYPEALRRIEDEVAQLKHALDTEGSYTLDNLGTLTVNSEGHTEFEPCEAGVLSPEYYGLGATEFLTLKDHRHQLATLPALPQETQPEAEVVALDGGSDEPATPTLLEFTDNDEDDERAIRIKMSWVRNAVAVAAAVVAFFLMATPIANSDLGSRTMSQLHGNLLYRLMPQDTNMVPAEPVTETLGEPAVKEAKSEVKATAAPAARYCIVLASQVRRSNAEQYVEQLRQRGYETAEVFVHNDLVRVVYGAFQTEGEAYRQLNRLNVQDEFAEAWVYKKPV